MPPITHIPNISTLASYAGVHDLQHTLFLVVRIEDIPRLNENYPTEMTYGFYSIGIKKNLNGYVTYGRQQYDFQQGILGFTAPNQQVSYEINITEGATGWILFFHPEMLAKHSLASRIHQFGFFDYKVNEALHLSKKEEDSINGIFENIQKEYLLPIDAFSNQVVVSNIELLLTYTERFYKRQFLIRNEANPTLLLQFEEKLHQYFSSPDLTEKGLPTVEFFADQLHLSSKYLSDLLKSITGKTTQEHIHIRLIDLAKLKLLSSNDSISEIAYALGFEYPQYFSRLFKEKTGTSPKKFRLSNLKLDQ